MTLSSGRNKIGKIENRNVFVLVGPTASGKTPISLFIAQHLNTEIISADSRQIYKLMDIGTAKPSLEDRKKVKHYFVDELLPNQDFNAGEFGKQGREIINSIFRRKKMPLIVGGSGLYIQALVDGFFDGPSAEPTVREHLYHRFKTEGGKILLEELWVVDPPSASKMLPSNIWRIIRALEVYHLTGLPISEMQKSRIEINFTPIFVGLQWDRQKLYAKINRRVDCMIEQGLVEEVKKLQVLGYSSNLNALQTVGYKEVFDFLEGKFDHQRMVELIKQNSRRYAKRQLTWFRRDKRIRWFEVSNENDFSSIASSIFDYIQELQG